MNRFACGFLLFSVVCGQLIASELDELLAPLAEETKADLNSDSKASKKSGILLTKDALIGPVTEALTAAFSIQDGSLHVEFLKATPEVWAPSKHWQVEVREGLPHTLSSRFIVRVKVVCDEFVIGNWAIPVSCEWWRDVLVTRRPLMRGGALDSSLFTTQSVDVLRQRRQLVIRNEDLSTYEMLQAVQAGQPLAWSDLVKHPEIKKGDVVEIFASEGLMKLSMKAVALQDGRKNDFISVRNLQSKKEIQVQVVNEKVGRAVF